MKWLRAILIVLALVSPVAAQARSAITLFQTEQAAAQHCPSDQVVWVNLPSGLYHLRGERWYART